MPPKTRSGKAKIQSKQTKNHTEPQIMEEEHPPVPHKTKRKADRGAEELVKEVPEKKAPSKKIKQLSFAPTTTFPAPTQPFTTQSHNTTLSFKPQPDRNQLATNPFSDILFNMRSNLSLSKNPKDLEEEYRLLEELISTENRYHALKFKQIIIDLKSKDELKIMDAVTRLSTELSMAQEENFGQLQLDFLIPELIRCLQMENPEIMMHSAISITHILDIMPAASKILVNSGGVEVLCQKMQNFEYIDVAESSIKALEKVSGDFGLSILSAGGMEIMLTMIDFFVAQTQKLIMSIISNIFKLINSETMLKEKILPVLPLVLSYTQSDPSRQEIMYNMIHRLSDRVVRLCGEDFEKKREYIEIIAQDRMTANFCQVLNDLIESFDQAKLESIENILKTLNKFCYYSLPLCMEAFDGGIISIIDKLISILESPAGKENQFSNLAYETISLVNSILALRATPNPLIGKIAAYVGIKITENCNVQGRMEMFKNHPYIFQNLIEKVGLRLPGIFENNAGTLFKYIVLISFQKLIEFSDTEALSKQFDLQVIANFLSKLTTSNDIMIIAITFIIVDLLITKIPETYVILTREGVIDCIKALSSVTEANKLEAYSVVAKRYNPLDTLKQFTTSLNRMAAGGGGGSTDFFANLEAESHRLESIMQQLQFMKNPPESFSDSNDSKTLSSAEEGSPAEKSPAKAGMFSLQNIPKSASLEHKFITGLNKKPSKETGLMEEEAIPLEKPAAMNQPVDKMTEVRRDIAVFAQEIYNKVKVEMQKRNVSNLTPASITTKLEEISLSLEQNQWNPTEFGQKDFQKYLDLVSEHGRITNYELKNSKILSHLLNFIFDNVLLDEKENRKKVKSSPKEEEKKINSSDDLDNEKTKEKRQIELTDQQCRTILGRIISFLYHFKKIKNKATEEIHLQDFLKNLQEMLMNSDQFSLDSARNYQEYENNLNSDMRFLAQRVKFRAQYNPEVDSQSDKKKNLGMPNVLKQKSMRLEEEKKMFPSTLDNQAEMFSYKDSIFKEVPVLALSVEQFGTLEVIEDYLLNKLNSKDDLNGGLFGRHMHDFMSQRFGNPQETRDSEDDPSSQERESMEIEGTKKEGVNKVPVTNPKTKSPGSVNLQKSHSNIKTKNEGKFVRNDKKKWVDRLTGKEVNFKKYLECKFYLNGEELDKNITIYEIFTKYKGINMKYSGAFGDLGVEYKLALKKMETFEFSSGSRDQYKQPNMICLDHKSILQNLANRISSLDLKSTETSSVKEIIQMIIFIHELVDLDRRILSPATVLNTLLIDLKNRYGLEDLITAYREDSVHLIRKELIPKNEFVNKKISLVTYKYLNDPITLAGGQVPDLLREICQKAPFILDFKSKYHYYKNGCFHISRALHYIYQTNKTRLKDLEGSRIGKLHRKKIKVSRDKILENAVVNFESYGSKKSVLDFEFQDEEGTGLGPTLEYYSMIASEVKNPEHHFWQQTANNLLFPSPIDPTDLKHPDPEKSKKRLHLQNKKRDFEKFQLVFRCIGTLLGRAILDERIVDVPLHSTFWDIILEKPLYIEDVSKIDPNLGDTLLGLQAVVNKKQEIENDQSLTPIEKDERINNLQFKGCTIEDLTLTFTLPGYDEIELIENGPDTPVTIANLDQYVSLLTKFILMETLKSQVFAFREGFDKVIPLRHINIFESDEIEALVCGGTRDEAWDVKTLEDNFVPAHGYTQTSKSFKNFVKIVSEFTSEEKRIFLKFVTGAERLPFGGFKNLNPKLTVVKKQPNHHTEHPDQYLPSVMTCQNYVKLPDYSTFEVMKKKLFFSMNEGQNSFSLS